MRFILLFLFSLPISILCANDGAYYASGNHLIPIEETDISVQKEVLSINRVAEDMLEVKVEYSFYNPVKAKSIIVGFEAPSPQGDVDGTPINGNHPYIKNFSVVMNNSSLPFKVAIVKDSNYYENKAITSKTVAEVTREFNENYPDFYYVYYFTADFKKGVNSLTHTYQFQLSSSVEMAYSFEYILTAATRWANKQIDDFTLKIDLGQFQECMINRSFFNSSKEWAVNGTAVDISTFVRGDSASVTQFYIQEGAIVFKKMDFRPKNELVLFSTNAGTFGVFDARKTALPFAIGKTNNLKQSIDENSFKILRNLPYARRGYIFKTQTIQQYYESLPWYVPNNNYKADYAQLTAEEQKWVAAVRANGVK